MKTSMMVLILGLLPLAGCSLLSSPTPESDMRLQRAALDGKGRLMPADTLAVPNRWAADNILLRFERTYQPASETGQEILASEKFEFTRLTDPKVAGEVAIVRARATADVTTETVHSLADVGKAALTAGASTGFDAMARSLAGRK